MDVVSKFTVSHIFSEPRGDGWFQHPREVSREHWDFVPRETRLWQCAPTGALTEGVSCRVCHPRPPWSEAVPASCSPGAVSGWLLGPLHTGWLSGRRRWCRHAALRCSRLLKAPGPGPWGPLLYWQGLLYTFMTRGQKWAPGSPPQRTSFLTSQDGGNN